MNLGFIVAISYAISFILMLSVLIIEVYRLKVVNKSLRVIRENCEEKRNNELED